MWLERLIEHLDSNGFSQSVITLESRGEINEYLERSSVNVFSPKSSSRLVAVLESAYLIRRARIKGARNFLLLHGHMASIAGMIGGRVTKTNFGVIHHMQPKYFEFMRSRKPFRGFIHQRIYRCYVRRAQMVQSLSREVTDSIIASGCDPRRILSVGHGVDFTSFYKSMGDSSGDLILKSGYPRVLAVGRLAWEKNYPLALESFAQLLRSYPNAQLLIAGTGPLENDIKSMIVKLGLGDSVSLLGRVKNVPRLMAECDLFLHLAVTESYGQVYIEACLANLPIFTLPAGVAMDLAAEGNPLVHILAGTSPEVISEQIVEFLRVANDASRDIAPPKIDYGKHDQRIVFQEMVDFLTRLLPELD